jgi:DNA-binding MarR family transcriptional regulator
VELPSQLLAPQHLKATRAQSSLGTAPIGSGARNWTLFRIACSLRGVLGFGSEEIRAALVAVNKQRCTPPLDDREVEQIAQSAGKYRAAPRWVSDPIAFSEDPVLSSKERHLLIALARYCNREGVCRPSIRRLHQDTNMAKDTIAHAIGGLVAKGRITVQRRPRTSSRYQLLDNREAHPRRQPGTGSSLLDARTDRGTF